MKTFPRIKCRTEGCKEEFVRDILGRCYCGGCTIKRKICPECGKPKNPQRKFCSRSCAGKHTYKNNSVIQEGLTKGRLGRKKEKLASEEAIINTLKNMSEDSLVELFAKVQKVKASVIQPSTCGKVL